MMVWIANNRIHQNYNIADGPMQDFLSLKNVAELLKVKPYRIHYVLAVKLLPEPVLRVGNKRVFTQADITGLAAHFGVKLPDTAEIKQEKALSCPEHANNP